MLSVYINEEKTRTFLGTRITLNYLDNIPKISSFSNKCWRSCWNSRYSRRKNGFLLEGVSTACLLWGSFNCFQSLFGKFPSLFSLQKPSHHVSIAWCVGDQKEELEKLALDLQLETDQISCNVDEIRCKIGNTVKRLWFCYSKYNVKSFSCCPGFFNKEQNIYLVIFSIDWQTNRFQLSRFSFSSQMPFKSKGWKKRVPV